MQPPAKGKRVRYTGGVGATGIPAATGLVTATYSAGTICDILWDDGNPHKMPPTVGHRVLEVIE